MSDPKPQPVEVTQADCQRAANYYEERGLPVSARCAREGRNDRDPLIQMLARHRIASIEEARRG